MNIRKRIGFTSILIAAVLLAIAPQVKAAETPTVDRYSHNFPEAVAPQATGDSGGGGGTNTDAGTFSGPLWDALRFLGTGSNWMIAPYGIASTDGKNFGGGIGVGYRVSDYVVPTMRLDYYAGQVWMPSASLQLQAPLTILGKLTLIPFAFTGLATPIAGKGHDNGTAVGIFGVGGAVRITQRFDAIGDFETWTGFKAKQIRFGIVYKI